MANKSISKVLDLLNDNINRGLSKETKNERIKLQNRRKKYHLLLDKSRLIHVPKKIWKYISNVNFLGELTKTGVAPVPYANQTLLFQPSFQFSKHLVVEYIHIYKYDEKIDCLFPLVKDLGFLLPPSSFIPVGDIGIQVCLRHGRDFPILISIVIVDFQLFIQHRKEEGWSLLTENKLSTPEFIYGLMVAFGLNALAFISEPEKAYIWKKKLFRLPKSEEKQGKRTSPSSWTKSKIKRTQVVYEEDPEGDKKEYSEPEFQVEIPSHIRTLNYCKNCDQFIPLRYMRKEECPRCNIYPLVCYGKKSVVENFMKWKDKPIKEYNKDIYLSE